MVSTTAFWKWQTGQIVSKHVLVVLSYSVDSNKCTVPNYFLLENFNVLFYVLCNVSIKRTVKKIVAWEVKCTVCLLAAKKSNVISLNSFNLDFKSLGKVEIFFEKREVAFLSPSKICENLNFSTVHH
jgi:hypothetical protein